MAQKKKPATAKKTNTKAKTASNKAAKQTKSKAAQQAQIKQNEAVRIATVLTFAASIFLFCVAVIEGAGFWQVLHDAYLGLFGFGAYLLPLLSIAVSIICAVDIKQASIAEKAIETTIMILLVCSLVHVIKDEGMVSYSNNLLLSYKEAPTVINGGFFGALIGGAFLSFGKTAAIVTNVILLFTTFMFLSGLTLIQLFKTVWKPVEKTQQYVQPVLEEKREQRRTRKAAVDIDLGPESEQIKPKRGRKKRTEPDFIDPVPAEPTPIDLLNNEADNYINIFKTEQDEDVNDEPPQDNDFDDVPPLDEIIKRETRTKPVGTAPPVQQADDTPPSKEYILPRTALLRKPTAPSNRDVSEELKTNAQTLVDTLKSFGVDTKIMDISRGPTVTRYELKPSAGVKISRITGLADDIAMNLATSGVRIEAPIPNKAAVGIEVPNKISNTVSMRELIETDEFENAKSKLTAGIGKDIAGNCIYCDISKMPHLLIAGATGAGKSVCVNSIIVSILYKAKPDEVKFVMIDPKKVEFTMYSGIPHLLVPVVTDPRKAAGALGWAVSEMLQRYSTFAQLSVRDINGYNKMAEHDDSLEYMPQIVIFVDELSDLMMAAPKEVEDSICRLAQMARAAGMHLVIATQRPSVDVITGLIKANIPSRIALTVSSQIDSRTILDTAGAEKLLGRGDMLYSPVGLSKPTRVQGCFVTDGEIEALISYIKSQSECEYSEEISKEIEEKAVLDKKANSAFADDDEDDTDPLLEKAVETVLELGSASTSVLQRKLKVGYARGARIVDQLEEKGIIGPAEGSKPRKVLISRQDWFEMQALSSGAAAQSQLSMNDIENNEN